MKVRKLSAILLAGALMATPAVTTAAMAESSQTDSTDSTQNIVDESGNLIIEGTTVTGVTEKGKTAKDIIIPDGVTHIDVSFENCTNLENVYIPDDTVFPRDVFRNCKKLKNINVSENNTDFYSVDGVLFYKTYPKMVQYPSGRTDETYSIPDGIEHIGTSAFCCDNLKSIIIPDSVIGFGDKNGQYAFECPNLTDIYYTGTEEQWNRIAGVHNDKNEFDCGIPETATIHYNYIEYTDETTGVKVSSDGGVVEDGAKLSVKVVSDKTDSTKATYEITLTENDKEIQPDGEVTVKIPVPEAMKGKTVYVYRIEDDGTYTDMNAIVEDGYAVFKTDHFSEYVLTTEKQVEEPADSSDSETSSDTETSSDSETSSDTETSSDSETSTDSNSSNSGTTTPDTGVAGLSLTLGIVALAGAAVVISRKKR